MGVEIKVIDNTVDGTKRAQLLLESDNNYTSVIHVQAGYHINVGIKVGIEISDILSAAAFSATISQLTSVFSGTITLQRCMTEDDITKEYYWRDVAEWVISSSAGGAGGSENITAYPESENCHYRAGIKTAGYTAGVGHLRIGTN